MNTIAKIKIWDTIVGAVTWSEEDQTMAAEAGVVGT